MLENYKNIITVDSETDVYENVDDYFKAKELDRFTQHKDCFETLISDIGFDKCKHILFDYVHTSELLFDYKRDEHFNSSKLQQRSSLDYFTSLYTDVHPNKWDEIGHRMLRANRNLYIKGFSFCDLTCLAKACARMVVNEYRKGRL